MNHKFFASLMTDTLRKYGLSLPDNLQQDTCTISFERRPDVHYVNHIAEYIDVVSHIGKLPSKLPADKLTSLLALNNFERDEPMVTVTIYPPTGTLSLLARQSIHNTNVALLTKTTEAIYRKHEMVKEILEK